MHIEMITTENKVTARIEGSMDAIGVANDRDAATRVLETASTGIHLDLRSVSFMDASGLGFISHIVKRSSDLGLTVSVANANGQPAEFLKSLGLDRVLNITMDAAPAANIGAGFVDTPIQQAA